MINLTPLLSPQSICMIGASEDPATLRGRILDFLFQRNYPGTLHLVSPNHAEIRGIKTVKSVSEIYAPMAGQVVAVNDALDANPEVMNADPYGAGWLVTFQPTDLAQAQDLLDAAAYEGITAH